MNLGIVISESNMLLRSFDIHPKLTNVHLPFHTFPIPMPQQSTVLLAGCLGLFV